MGAFFLILTEHETRYSHDPDVLDSQLRARFGTVEYLDMKVQRFSADYWHWWITVGSDVQEVSLQSDQSCIDISDSGNDHWIAQFSAWYRTIVPDEYPLRLRHSADPYLEIILAPQITEQEILNALALNTSDE